MRKIISALLLAATTVLIQAAEGDDYTNRLFLSDYVQTPYDEDSAIPMLEVKSVLQTSDKYLWFAGYQGLMRYNGTETKTFMPEDGFPSFKVNILYEDAKKRLWIGTNDNGVVLYEKNVFTVYGLDSGLPSASVRDISEDENGTVYVSTTGGVAMISPEGVLAVHPQLDGVFVLNIVYAGQGRFLCLLNDGRIIRFDEQKIIQTYSAGYFNTTQPYSLFLSKGGSLFIGTADNEVVISDLNLSRYTTVTVSPLQTHNDFFEDNAGRVWICAENGVGYLSNGVFFPVDGLIMTSRIECMYEDYEGSYWIGSSRSGLLQLTRGKFTNVSFISRLPNYVVNTTMVWGGDLYIGTDAGLIVLQNHVPIENELTKMLAGIRIRSMTVDSRDQLWICTFERYGVLLVKRNGSPVAINENRGLANNRVRCVLEASNGDIYTGSSGGISVIRNETVVKSYRKDDGLANDVILSLCEGAGGIIYAGSDGGGIYAIDTGRITANYAEKDGLASGIILRMAPAGDGVWISTGNAVCYMNGTGIRVIDKLVLYDDSVFGIKIIGNEIWFLRSKSVSICDIPNLLSDGELTMKQLQRRDGLSSSVTANSWNALADDGTLYICTSTGVFSIDTRDFHQNETVPYAGIPAIFADGKQVFETDGVLTIASNTQRIDIHIALLSFASRDGTLSYMLEGFDNGITTIGRNDIPRISYTNLSGGKYTFRLYGTNADGIQSETIVLTINKEYTLLETLFVRMLLGLLVIGAIVLCVRIFISQRTKTLIVQRQEYKEVAAQIMAVAASMADLKEEHITNHSRRIAAYSKMIGARLGMSEPELETLYYAALLHDIGLVGIPDSILSKNGRLTNEEFDIVKKHVTVGGDLLKDITVMGDIAVGAKYHHERIDGKGYTGLKGDEIPLMAKIICVCNAFDSMLSDQAYRKAMSIERAQSEFISNAGTQFDEKITAILISLINEGEIPL